MNEKELVDKILEREKETLPVMLATLTEYEAIEALLETLKVAIYKDGFYRKDGKHRVIRHEDYVRLSDVLNGTDMPELNTAIVMRGKKEVGSEMDFALVMNRPGRDKMEIFFSLSTLMRDGTVKHNYYDIFLPILDDKGRLRENWRDEMNKFIGEWAQEADKIRISLKNRGTKLAVFIHEAVEASKKIERVKGMIEYEIYPELSNKYPHFSINDIV
jgi:hypothetical protein